MIANNMDDLIISYEKLFSALFEWFKNNLLKSNVGKCRLMDSKNNRVRINVAGCKIDKSGTEKLLGTKFDKKLNFDDRIYKNLSPPIMNRFVKLDLDSRYNLR